MLDKTSINEAPEDLLALIKRTKNVTRDDVRDESPELSDDVREKCCQILLGKCYFIQHCKSESTSLPEREWWSMIHNLACFGAPGRKLIQELSREYPGYSEAATNDKIEQVLKAKNNGIGPHTCAYIGNGFACPDSCLNKQIKAASPAGMAVKIAFKKQNDLPRIIVSNRQLPDKVNDCLNVLYDAENRKPTLFERGGYINRITRDEKHNPHIETVNDVILKGVLSRLADFVNIRDSKDGPKETSTSLPKEVVDDILTLKNLKLPALAGISEIPIIHKDGKVIPKLNSAFFKLGSKYFQSGSNLK